VENQATSRKIVTLIENSQARGDQGRGQGQQENPTKRKQDHTLELHKKTEKGETQVTVLHQKRSPETQGNAAEVQ